jgi:hypothetical protein
MTRVLVLAAGDGKRWNNFRGTSKHLTEIEGEVLLHRTCRQFLKHTSDVVVVGPDRSYKVLGTGLFIPPPPKPQWHDAAKFWSSHEIWGSKRTILIFGDVYFTDEAVDTIMTNTDEWKCFLRKGPSSVTGCEHKKIFAFAFNSSQNQRVRDKIAKLIAKNETGRGGWQLFSELVWDTHHYRFDNPHYVNIDDWTEDFDFPEDLTTWEKKRSESIPAAEKSRLSSQEGPEK